MPDFKKRFVVVDQNQPTSLSPKKSAEEQNQETAQLLENLRKKVRNRTATNKEIGLYNYNIDQAQEFQKKLTSELANSDDYTKRINNLFQEDLRSLNFNSKVLENIKQRNLNIIDPTRFENPEWEGIYNHFKSNFEKKANQKILEVQKALKNNDFKTLRSLGEYFMGPLYDTPVKQLAFSDQVNFNEEPDNTDRIFYNKEIFDLTKRKTGNFILALASSLEVADMLSNPDNSRIPEVRNTIDQKNRIPDALNSPEYLKRIGRELLKQGIGSKLYGKDQAFIHEVQSADNVDNSIDYEATQVAINALKNLSAIDYRSKIAEYSRLKLYADKTGDKVDLEKADNALKEAESVLNTAENFDPDNFLKNNYKQTYLKIKEQEAEGEKRRLGYDYWKKDYPNLTAALDYIPFPDLVKTWQSAKSGIKELGKGLIATGLPYMGDNAFEKAENIYTYKSLVPDKTSHTIGIDEEGKPVESTELYWTDKQGKLHINGYSIIETGIPVAYQMLETIVLVETGGLLLRGAGSALSLAARTALGAERAALVGESILGTKIVGSAAKPLTNPEVYNRALTFSSVYATTYPRIYAEEYNNFKNKENALNVAKMRSTVEALTESIIPNTADLFSRGSKGLLGIGRRSYTQDLTAGLDGVVGGMFPGASSKFVKNLGESMAFRRAMGYGKDLFQEAVVEEEASLLGNYFVDKYAKSINKDYVEQNELTWENIVKTGIESAAAMLLTVPFMGGGKRSTIQREDTDAITSARWNIANNPNLYKSVVASQVKAGEITQEQAVQRIAKIDQYVKALETLPIKNLSSIRDMKTLLENKDAQYDFFSKHLQKQALLEYVPTDEELPAYTAELEKLDAELYKTQKLADKYGALSIQDKREIIFDNFKDKTNTLLNSDDVSPVVVQAQLMSASQDYKKNKNRLFGTELQGYMVDLQAAVEAVIPKFKSFIANNNEGLTPEQRDYKARLLFANQGFISKEEVESLFNILDKSASVAYAPLFSIQNEDEFIESLSRNYVTAATNKKPLTSDGELLFDKIRDQYIEDTLFNRFTEGLSEEEAKIKKDELKDRFWARVVELKQNQRDGQAFPDIAATPVTQEEEFEAAAAETQSKYQPLIANYRQAVERDLTEDQEVIREETVDALIEEESIEDLVKGLANVQSIFISDNLKKIAQEVQEGKTDKLVEFLEENGATKKQIEKLLNKIGIPATATETAETATTETTEGKTEVKPEVKPKAKIQADLKAKKEEIEKKRQAELNKKNEQGYSLPMLIKDRKEALDRQNKSRDEAISKGIKDLAPYNQGVAMVAAALNRYNKAVKEINARYDLELAKVLQQEMEQLGKMMFDFTPEEQRILREYGSEVIPTTVKPGVAELFESNQELADAVYEALGYFKSNQKKFETPEEFEKRTGRRMKMWEYMKDLTPDDSEITEKQEQQAQELYSQYIEQTGKQDIEGFKEFVAKPTQVPVSVETISPEALTEPVTEPAKETKEDETYEAQQKLNQEAATTQAVEDVRENYVYLGIHDTEWTKEDPDKTRLTDENVEFVFGFIDRIEESINSADMRSLGYNLLMHSSREVLNRVGLDIQPKSTLEEFSEQFRVNGIPVLPQEQIEALFKNPNALDTTKLGIVTNEKGEPLFFDKFGQKVTTGTPIVVRIGQVYGEGKKLDDTYKTTIPAEGQIAPLSKFINGKVIVDKPISVKESNSLIMNVGKEEQVPAGKGFFTLYPGVIYLPTGNSNFPYRATYNTRNTKESADKVVTLIEAYNNAKLNPEQSTLSDYFTSMNPAEFIKYLYNYAFIPKNSSKYRWGIVPVALKGEKQATLVRIYNNSNRNEDIPREEAVNLVSSTAASPSKEFFEGNKEFRPFTVEEGKVKTGKAMSFKTWYGNFRNSNARIDGVANRNLAFAKQDVKPLTQSLTQPLVEAKTPTQVVIESVLPEVTVTEAPVSDKKADIERRRQEALTYNENYDSTQDIGKAVPGYTYKKDRFGNKTNYKGWASDGTTLSFITANDEYEYVQKVNAKYDAELDALEDEGSLLDELENNYGKDYATAIDYATGYLAKETINAFDFIKSIQTWDLTREGKIRSIKAAIDTFNKTNLPNKEASLKALNTELDALEGATSVSDKKAPVSGTINFQEDQNTGYAARTKINASADATIAIAYDFNSAGEKLTKSSVLGQNKKYIPIDVAFKLEGDEISQKNKLKDGQYTFIDSDGDTRSKSILILNVEKDQVVRTPGGRYASQWEGDIVKFTYTGTGATAHSISVIGGINDKGIFETMAVLYPTGWRQQKGKIDFFNVEETKETSGLNVTQELVNKIVNELNSVNAKSLNIAGNGIYTMKGKYTQEEVDDFTYELLKAVIESPTLKNKITSIRTGGQTGFDEAGAKAGIKLGIPTLILAPKGWKFRNISGQDISNEQAFKARFSTTQAPVSGNPLVTAGIKPTDMYGNAAKDIQMAAESTQFIGFGTIMKEGNASSTDKYAKAWGDKANTGNYTSNDVIMVSGSGNFGRGGVDKTLEAAAIKKTLTEKYKPLLEKATAAGASFRIGNQYSKGNLSDQLIAEYLQKKGYIEEKLDGYSRWSKPLQAPVISEKGKLPNDIKEEFKGKFIYATPGAGKTTLAQGMQGVVDTDVLMIEEMKKRHPEFFAEAGESIQEFIFRYVKTHDHKEEINKVVLSQAKKLASEGNTVLTGTLAFIKDVDIVITAAPTLARIVERFKTQEAANSFSSKETAEIQKEGKIAQPITNFLEFYLTNKGFTEPTTPPSNLPTRRGKRGDSGPVILERSKLYTRQVTEAQEKAAERWVNTVGKKAFGDNRYLIEQLMNNPEAWAIWSEAAGMVLFADASFTDLYHESWHEFSQLYFTPKQREALYKLAAKIYGTLPTDELEERLAEDFRQFMMTGVMPESIQKYKEARTTFQKIADFLRNLFSNKKTVDRYFENLAKGKVGNKVGKPGFKTLKSAKALSLYDENGKLVDLSFEESKRYLDMIDEAFVMMGDYLATQSKEAEIEQDPKAARGVSFANLMYSPANIETVYDRIFDYFVDLEDQAAEVGDLAAQQQFVKIFGIDEKNINQIFNYHTRNSSLFTPEMVTEIEEAEQEDLSDTNLIKDELGSKSQLELAPAVVVNLIRSIPMVDSKGFIISNSLTDAPMFGDFTENWNILKNSLSGATSYEEILERIENLIPEYPQFQYLLNRLPVNITLDSAQQLRNSFFNTMSLEKVEGIQGVFNNEGKFNVNNTGTLDTKRVRDLWSLQFNTEKKGKFKTVSPVTGNYIVSPELFAEYPEAPKSPEDILNFLKEIGFNYSSRAQQAFLKDFNRLRPKFEYIYDKLRDVVLNSGTEVSDPFLAIRQAHVNANTNQSIKGKSYDLDRLVERESLYNLAFANDMVQVADGTSKFITVSPTYQTKVVAALNDPKYKYFEDLFTEFPELDPSKNWGLANSAYLAYLFDFTTDKMVDGKIKHERNMREGKPVSLAIVSMDGITAEEDYGFNQKTIDLEDPEKHLADIKTLLAPYGRVEENNRIGEKSTTRGLMLNADNYFLYDKNSYFIDGKFNPKPQIWNIIYNYLEAEAKITDRTSVSENFNKNKFFEGTPQLAYFSEILDPALRFRVYEFFKTNTVQDFEESALKKLVKTAITSWIANQAVTSQSLLYKFEGYKVKGKTNDFQVSLDELKRYHTLSMIHRIEQYKLFNYHPYYYKNAKDVEKRIPAFNAHGLFPVIDQENLQYTEASLRMQKAFEKYANEMGIEVLPRKGSLSDVTYLVAKDEALDSQTARENKEDYGIHYNSYAETKKPVEVQDSASVILLDFFRKFYALSKGLTKPMKDELDRQSTIWTNLLALKANPANAEARENLNKALNTNPHFIFSVKKFQYAGPGSTASEVVPVFHKYANKILLPSEMVDNEELFNIAVKLHASNADYLIFKTGTKITETVKPVSLFDKGKVDTTPKETGIISLRYLKEQQEVEHKTDDLIIFATQFRKLLFKDVKTEKEKELLKDYKNAIKELTGYDVDQFLSKIKDKKSAVEFLIKELDKKNVSAITKDLIRFNEETQELEYAVDSVIERTLAENAITSAIKKSIIRQKFTGTQFVQFPVSLVRPNRKLKFYRIKDGKIASAEAIIAFSKKYYSLLDLPFDQKSTIGKRDLTNKDGKPINPYDALKRLNQKLADPAFREKYKDSLTLAGVRIPGQGYNSMEKMEIVEFLPEESGNIILVPDELVVKSGGDFDIDKLFMYEPILRNGVMLTYENSEAKKLEDLAKDLAKAPEGRTKEEIEKGAALTKLTIEEYMAKTGFTIMESEDLRSATKPKHLLEAAAEREQRGLLQNNLLNIIKERLSQREIFEDLIEPNNVKELDEYAKSAPKYLTGDTNKIIKDSSGRDMWTNLVNPHYQLYVYQLAHAMEMVGVAAKANTFQSAVQDAKLEIIDQNAIDLIYFDTNKNSEGHIKLWEIYDTDKKNKISQIISQLISGSVDVVKNDNILKNNINPNTVSVALYLNMMGVRYKDINTFLKDESIYRFSKGETLQEILRDSFREYYDEFAEFTKSGTFSNYATAVKILQNTNKENLLTDKTKFGSLARLAQFVVLKTQQANYVSPLIIGTDYDTQSVKNFESVTRKEQDIAEVYKSNFFNREGLDKIVYDSTVAPFRIGSNFIQNFEYMFPISANKGLIDFISTKYKDLKKTWIDYDNFSRRVKNALLTSILETNMDEFQEFAQYLKVDPNVKNLGDILTEIKTEAAQNGAYIPLLDSVYFVGNINSDYIAPAVFRNDNNLDVDVKKEQFKNNLNWDSVKEQEVSEEFRNKVRNFFRIFAYTGIISTQLNKSHGSFLEIIPEEIYTPVIDRFVRETSTDIAKGKDSEFLNKFYNRFNYNNPDIFRSPFNVRVANPSLKFYRNYNLNITQEELENEYPREVEKVKPSPAPVPTKEAIFTPDLEEARNEPLPEVKADTVAEIDELTKQSAISVFDFLSEDKPVDQDIINKANEMPDDESTCGPPA